MEDMDDDFGCVYCSHRVESVCLNSENTFLLARGTESFVKIFVFFTEEDKVESFGLDKLWEVQNYLIPLWIHVEFLVDVSVPFYVAEDDICIRGHFSKKGHINEERSFVNFDCEIFVRSKCREPAVEIIVIHTKLGSFEV